jgi:hypothetical protein
MPAAAVGANRACTEVQGRHTVGFGFGRML